MTVREPTAAELRDGINRLTVELARIGLTDDQEWPTLTRSAATTTVSTAHPPNRSVINATSYDALYNEQAERRAFNFVMLDKALVHFAYEFQGHRLSRHRVVFLPSPHLVEFQNDSELYLREHLYADVIGPQGLAVPMRFDFDVRQGQGVSIDHHATHLTLGQYKHCRIPVAAPVTPWAFMDFLVRHFYQSPAMPNLALNIEPDRRFDPHVLVDLTGNIHVSVPAGI
ncbi:DUF2290 domain-containing protein [Glaciihabitans arcticus]|uniref:DUF2290 domain-containing protein n=1 Tax=Glaciihabitans arcticus TaxID=2668039 RepID=A0A4Q9GR01_9MICO|nr:DUF2290 domain-containing protein [Glaciihabitans arcticus]TBN56008.1 DUF2290 domain-containing protein [Glaciihabitans arcticus]